MDDERIYWEHVVVARRDLRGSESHPEVPDDACKAASLFEGYPKMRTERWLSNWVRKHEKKEIGTRRMLYTNRDRQTP